MAFADGAWKKNAAVFEQKDPLDTVLALDADDAVPDDEVVKEAEAAAVEVRPSTFLKWIGGDAVAEGVLVPAGRAPPTGWHVDRFLQGPGSTPPWRLRPPTCEPELWLIIGKPRWRSGARGLETG